MFKWLFSERELIARLVQCEAGGEGDSGMRGVASVVMSRVRVSGGEYSRISNGGNIRAIIFQQGQFNCVAETLGGRYNAQNIYNMRPEAIHYSIADWALAGNILTAVGNSLWFFNPYSSSCPSYFPSNVGSFANRVVNHCYYQPTQAYYNT